MKQKLLLDSSWLAVAAALGRAGVVVSSVVVARLLGKDQFGLVAIVQSTVLMFGGFLGVGFGMTATKILAERRSRAEGWPAEELSLLSTCNLGLATLGALIMAGANSWISRVTLGSDDLAPLLVPGAWLLVATAINFFQTGVLSGLEEFRNTAIANALSCVAIVVCILAGVSLWGAQGAIIGHAIGMTFACMIFHRILYGVTTKMRCKTSVSHLSGRGRILLRQALPNVLLSWVNAPIDWLCLAILARSDSGPGEVAIFSACNQWCLLLRFLPMTIAAALLPATARAAAHGLPTRSLINFAMTLNGLFAAAAALAIVLLSPWIIAGYGSEFTGCAPVLYLLLASGTAIAIQLAADRVLTGLDYVWSASLINVVRGVAYVALAASFISYGALGLAVARCSSSVLHAAASAVAAYVASACVSRNSRQKSADLEHDTTARNHAVQAA